MSTKDNVIVDWNKIEDVNRYVYLGQMRTKDHDQVQEIKKRIAPGWSAFRKLDSIMQDTTVPMRLKRKAINGCILQVMTYGCETWSHSNTQLHELFTIQRKMERIMIKRHPQGEKEYELPPETEWDDSHYLEQRRKQTQMSETRGEKK